MSQGDPAQFIVAGSIGDQRVNILVDTGATISFITSSIVPMLTPAPEVRKSELSVVLGNSETQDTDHYVSVPLTIHSCALPANLHLLQLPEAFDVIVGLDWLALHDSHVHVRARSLEITNSVGKRILVAACGGVMSGLPRREPSVEWGHLATTLCFLQPTTATRKASLRKDHHEGYDGDRSHVEHRKGHDFDNEVTAAMSTKGALMLMGIREYVETRRSRRADELTGVTDSLCMSVAQKRAYHASATPKEKDTNEELKKEFERLRACMYDRFCASVHD